MISRDYTKETGNRAGSPHVPLPIAFVVLAIVGAALWMGVVKIRALPSAKNQGGEAHSAEPARSAVAAHPAPR